MSRIFKKITGASRVALAVKMEMIELMGQAVADKDMFCVHWTMKGLRGTESSAETENVRATISDGASYAVARFTDVFAGELHAKPRKDGGGYEAQEFDMRVVCPALRKRDETAVGRATVNIFEKVPVVAAGQPAHHAEQTIPINKDGTAVAHLKYSVSLKSDSPVEETEATEPEAPVSPTSPTSEPPSIVVKTPPETPQKESGSETGTTGTSDLKEETESKSRHKKRHSSSTSAALNAQLKKKDEELQQKDEELKQKDEELKQKDEELKKKDEELKKKDEEALEKQKELGGELEETKNQLSEVRKNNEFLEGRVKELERANEKTDVTPADPAQEKMQESLANLQSEKERLEEEKMHLAEELEAAQKEVEELKSHDQRKELELLNEQLTVLQEELSKAKQEIAAPAASAPAGNGMMMQVIFGAVGAVVGIIIGYII